MSGRTGRGSSLARAGRRAGGGWSAFQPRGRPPPASAMARSLRLYRPRLSAPVQVVALRHRGTPPPAVACVLLPPAAMRAAPARPLRHLGGLQPPVCRPRGHLRVAPSPPHAGRDRLLWRPYPRLGRLRPPARRSPPPPRSRAAIASCPPRRLGALRLPACRSLLPCGPRPTEPPPPTWRAAAPLPRRLDALRSPARRPPPARGPRSPPAPPPRLLGGGITPLRSPCAEGRPFAATLCCGAT